jgi:hypothetical protein
VRGGAGDPVILAPSTASSRRHFCLQPLHQRSRGKAKPKGQAERHPPHATERFVIPWVEEDWNLLLIEV